MKPFEFINDYGTTYITISSPSITDIRQHPSREGSIKIIFNDCYNPAKSEYRFVFKEDIKRFLNHVLENIEEYIA